MQQICIIDPDFAAEELLHRKMEIMHETWIVNDTRIINVAETDFYWLSKRHESIPSFKTTILGISEKGETTLS
jgi:hypothetical protein